MRLFTRMVKVLAVSRNLNSKVHFAKHAPQFGLPVPATLHCQKKDLASESVAAFFAAYPKPLMLKTLGLAGARNVTTVGSVIDAADYVAEYADAMDVILQERLDVADYTEMTVDLFVGDDDIRITNVRRIMFADGLWVGNLLGPSVQLSADHERELIRVGEYARSHGFSAPQGLNLGVDYFVRNAAANAALPELLITEINARWTGGLFPAELVRRLGVGDADVLAFIDLCPPERFCGLPFVHGAAPVRSAHEVVLDGADGVQSLCGGRRWPALSLRLADRDRRLRGFQKDEAFPAPG